MWGNVLGILLLKFYLLIYFLAVLGLLLHVGFLYLWQVVLLSSCGMLTSHCNGLSCCRVWALEHRLSSVAVVHRLSCYAACEIFSKQGLNPCPSAGRFFTTGSPEKFLWMKKL